MKRRISVAIDLPPDLETKVSDVIRQWQWLPIRWLAPEQWHATIIPPVYLDSPAVEELAGTLKNTPLGKSPELTFTKISLAPPGVAARMIWLEGNPPPRLSELVKQIEKTWTSIPAIPHPKSESRPLKLHVTLARFEPGELRELEEKTHVLGEVSLRFTPREVALIESHLRPEGAEYATVAAFPLTGH